MAHSVVGAVHGASRRSPLMSSRLSPSVTYRCAASPYTVTEPYRCTNGEAPAERPSPADHPSANGPVAPTMIEDKDSRAGWPERPPSNPGHEYPSASTLALHTRGAETGGGSPASNPIVAQADETSSARAA